MSADYRVQPATARRICSECDADLSGRSVGEFCPKCVPIWTVVEARSPQADAG